MKKAVPRLVIVVGLVVVLVGAGWLWGRLQTTKVEVPIQVGPLLPQPTPTIYPSPVTVLERVQGLSRLETASYHMEKVITAESGQGPLGFLFGDKMLLIAYGQVIAGVDLSRIGPESVLTTDDGTVYLKMPPVEVFLYTLDNQRTYVYDRQTGLVGMNPTLETAARQEAERLILEAALQTGLLQEAEQNARDVLRVLLLAMGFQHVIFVDVMPTPTVTPTLLPPGVTFTPSP